MDKLATLRREIKEITREIIGLMGRRLVLVKEVEMIKRSLKLRIKDPKAERDLKKEVLKACSESGVEKDLGLKLVDLLIEEAIRVQKGQRMVSHRRSHCSGRK